jgi:predicted GNAT superfamily acetyltransferase
VRSCHSLQEYERCVELQRIVWGEDITVPAPVFVVATDTGGQVLGAFAGRRMIGFTLALAGLHGSKPFLHSHMTAVLPELQNRGVGGKLKLAQREDALARGIYLVEWTFDPLELRNAHFNLMKLGAIARRFIPNCYGVTESPVHAGLPTDRLMAEWWLRTKRVEQILAGASPAAADKAVRIPIPTDIGEWKIKERDRASRIQGELREQFQLWFGRGYAATALKRSGGVSNYVLEPSDSTAAGFEE